MKLTWNITTSEGDTMEAKWVSICSDGTIWYRPLRGRKDRFMRVGSWTSLAPALTYKPKLPRPPNR